MLAPHKMDPIVMHPKAELSQMLWDIKGNTLAKTRVRVKQTKNHMVETKVARKEAL